MKILYVIPARGGSKGIPKKNIKLLGGKPLIQYTIETTREVAEDIDICVSTDSHEIIDVVRKIGLEVPFVRPKHLAEDTSGSQEVLLHAVNHYEEKGIFYDVVVMLQPTSPFKKYSHIKDALKLVKEDVEMVCSFTLSHSSPYFNLYEKNEQGYMDPSKPNAYTRRQDCPDVYEQNGAIFIFSVTALKEKTISEMAKMMPYVMDDKYSVDLDTQKDWKYAEYLIYNELKEK